ncbi:MAG: glycosyltransferase family 2 protein [Fusobacterium mortiferum]|nr:glycosyltransferase family 2 protein [Fusobacterium mortiferum]
MEKYQPKISVIIPVYGVEKYIRQCLESIINQTYKNLEIIVVNDGTKDNSMKIVEEYLSDERIKIINKQNGGLSSARNRGIEEATGDYISFIDSDDWIDLNMYKELCSQLIDEDILIYRFFNYDNKKNEIMEEKK